MKTCLTFPGQAMRCETDAAVISNLLRKGWTMTDCAPEPEAPSCPPSVPALNLLHVLIDAGLYPLITSTINGIADAAERLKTQETFRRAATIERDHPLVLLVAQAAGKTSDEIDAYFRQAAQA